MKFIIGQIQQLGMVAVVMACATGGTIGMIKLIKHFFPDRKDLKGQSDDK